VGIQFGLGFCAALLAAGIQAATLPDLAPRVGSVFPLGARVGSAVEVEFHGRNLNDLVDVTFARKDIKTEVLASDYFSIKTRISIAAGVPTGLHDYRVRTARGTYVGVFHVSSISGVRETEPNNDIDHAQRIALPALIDGIVESADYDLFRFHADAGQTLVFDLLARRAGSRLDGTLGIVDARGNELDFNDDYYIHKDAHLEFRVQQSGDYFIRVSGSGEEGSKHAGYRLIAGSVPFISRMLPAGARRGAAGKFQMAGLNLGRIDRMVLGESLATGKVISASAGELTFQMDVPASVAPGRYQLHAYAGSDEAPLTFPILVSDLEEKLATPARRRDNPQPVTLPVAVNGTFDRKRGENFFSFEVRAGQRLAFEVDSMKLGYLDDPVVAIYTPEGTLLASDDDRLQQNGSEPPNLDPYLVHKFEQGGRYIAMIRDSAERGDPNYVYRLAIYPVEPDFDLKALTPAVTLYRGKAGVLPARVRRLGGWNTPVEVWVEDLAPGITSERQIAQPKDTIVKDNCALERKLDGTDVALPLKIAENAEVGMRPIRLRARGIMDGKTVERTAEVQYLWESVGKISGPIEEQKLVATVTDLPRVLIEPPESLTLTLGKTARLKVRVERFGNVEGPLTITPEPALEGVKFEQNVLQPGASQLDLRIIASTEVKLKSFRLRAGDAFSPPIELKMEEPEESPR